MIPNSEDGLIVALTIAQLGTESGNPTKKDRSILMVETGKNLNIESDEKPAPKSSRHNIHLSILDAQINL